MKELPKEDVSQGSILVMDLDPVAGHEQGGRRPVLVISIGDFYGLTGNALVVPITSKIKDFGLTIQLPDSMKTNGIILCQHIRSVDVNSRNARKVDECPKEVIEKVLDITDKMLRK